MAIFELKSPDGRVFEVEGPDGARPEEAYAILQGQLAQEERAARDARMAEFAKGEAPGDFGRGFDAVMPQTKALLGGTAALAGETLGADWLKDYGLGVYERNMAESQENAQPTDDIVTAYERARDDGDLGGLVDSAQYWSGYGVAQGLQTAATALIGSLVGGGLNPAGAIAGGVGRGTIKDFVSGAVNKLAQKKIAGGMAAEEAQKAAAKELSKKAGAGAALYANASSQGFGSVYPEALDEDGNIKDETSLTRIIGAGMSIGLIEAAADAFGVGQVLNATKAAGGYKGVLAAMAREAGVGIAREVPTEVVQTGIEQFGAGKDLTSEESLREQANAVFASLIGGGQAGVTSAAVGSLRNRGEQAKPAEEAKDTPTTPLQELTPEQLAELPDDGTPDMFPAELYAALDEVAPREDTPSVAEPTPEQTAADQELAGAQTSIFDAIDESETAELIQLYADDAVAADQAETAAIERLYADEAAEADRAETAAIEQLYADEAAEAQKLREREQRVQEDWQLAEANQAQEQVYGDSAMDNVAMEAAVPEATTAPTEQFTLPEVAGQKAARRAGAVAPEPSQSIIDPVTGETVPGELDYDEYISRERTITPALFDSMDINRNAPVRKLFQGRDLSDPQTRVELSETLNRFVGNQFAKRISRERIPEFLKALQIGFGENQQLGLFGPNDGPTNEARADGKDKRRPRQVAPTPAAQTTAKEPLVEQVKSAEPAIDDKPAKVEPVADGNGIESSGPSVEVGRGEASADAGRAALPDGDGLASVEPVVADNTVRDGDNNPTLIRDYQVEPNAQQQAAIDRAFPASTALAIEDGLEPTLRTAWVDGELDVSLWGKDKDGLSSLLAHRRVGPKGKLREPREGEAVGAPVIEAEPKVKAEPKAKTKAKTEAEPEAKSEAEPEAKSEAEPEAKSEAEPKPTAKAKAKPKTEAEPKAEPKPKADNKGPRAAAEDSGLVQSLGKALAMTYVPDNVPVEDGLTVSSLLRSPNKARASAKEKSARKYFSSYDRFIDAIRAIVHDSAHGPKRYRRMRGTSDTEAAFFNGTGKKSASRALKWIAENFSGKGANIVIKLLQAEQLHIAKQAALSDPVVSSAKRQAELYAKQEADEARVAAREARKEEKATMTLADEIDEFLADDDTYDSFDLKLDAVSTLDEPLHPRVVQNLKDGNLIDALRNLANSTRSLDLAKLVSQFSDNVGGVRVLVVDPGSDLHNKYLAPNDAAGRYIRLKSVPDKAKLDANPELKSDLQALDNTILIDSTALSSPHTLVHEVAHAVTMGTLSNPAHPLTKQVTALFNEVKDQLGTAYGAESVAEFVAEFFGNTQFQVELTAIYTGKGNQTAFQKMLESLINFWRKLMGRPQEAMIRTEAGLNRMMEGLISPTAESRFTADLFLKSRFGEIGKFVDDLGAKYAAGGRLQNDKPLTQFTDSALRVLGSTSPMAKKLLLYALPSQALADTINRYGVKGGYRLHELFELQNGAIGASDSLLDGTLKMLNNWVKANPQLEKTFSDVVHTSTIEQVDPSKPSTSYTGEKLAVWKSLQDQWKALGGGPDGGQASYRQLRDSYQTLNDNLKESIFAQIDSLIEDRAARNTLKNEVYKKLFEKANIEPYFPLVRKGDYILTYNAGGEFVSERFETDGARNRVAKELENTEGVTNIATAFTTLNANYSEAPADSFVGKTLKVLHANLDANDPAIEQIMRMFIDTLPETSFAKSMKHRENVAGYQNNAIFAFREKAYDLGRQAVKSRYSKELRAALTAAEEEVQLSDQLRGTPEANLIVNELRQRVKFAIAPPANFWANAARNANRFAFIGTIGFNLSSAIVNLSQVPLVVYPFLAGKTDMATAGRAVKAAASLFAGSSWSHRTAAMGANGEMVMVNSKSPSIDNYYDRDEDGNYSLRDDIDIDDTKDFYKGRTKKQLLQELTPLIQVAAERGQLNHSLFYDTLGAETSGKSKSIMDNISAFSAYPFHTGEKANRQTTLVATYLNEMHRLENDPIRSKNESGLTPEVRKQRAIENALYDTQMTNGGAVLETAPRIAQTGLGRVAMMYKTYAIQMYYTQFKTAYEALKDADPQVRKAAMRQIVGVQLSVLMMSGMQGLTVVGIVTGIANLFLDDEEEDAETILRSYIGETWYKGLLNSITGVDVSARIGLSNMFIQSGRYNFDPSVEKSIVTTLGGPFYGYASSIARGVGELQQGEIQRGIEAILPSAFRNVGKAYRYGSEGAINTRRGDPIFDDLTPGLLAAQILGFAPAEYSLNQERNQVLKKIDKAVNEKRTKLGRKYYLAYRLGDGAGMNEAQDEIDDFNDRHYEARLDTKSLRKSVKSHKESSKKMYNGVLLSPNMSNLMEMAKKWEQ